MLTAASWPNFWAIPVTFTPEALSASLPAAAAAQVVLAMKDPADAPEPEPELEEMPVQEVVCKFAVKPMAARRHRFFLSHCQTSGQDQTSTLNALLRACGADTWYDMQAQDLTATGMEEGVSESWVFLIFLSYGYMGRPFCLTELRWAIRHECKLLGVVAHGAPPSKWSTFELARLALARAIQ